MFWFTGTNRPIARHESDEPAQGRYDAQFHEPARLSLGPDHATDTRFCPNWGAPHGWGIFQLDNAPRPATAQELWNWQANIQEGIRRLTTDCRTDAEDWIERQIDQQEREAPDNDLEDHVFTFNEVNFQRGTDHTPTDALTIQRYNGAAIWAIYWDNGGPDWDQNTNNYIDRICEEWRNMQ